MGGQPSRSGYYWSEPTTQRRQQSHHHQNHHHQNHHHQNSEKPPPVTNGVEPEITPAPESAREDAQEPVQMPDYPADTVILHCGFGRGFAAPSLSPFVVKLETYLRVAEIPYQAEPRSPPSREGKVPWITYNQESVPDSDISIRYLNQKFSVDLQEGMTPEERANVLAFKSLIDDRLYWTLVYERFIMTPSEVLVSATDFPKEVVEGLMQTMAGNAYGQGMGRHKPPEVLLLAENCLQALSGQLGNKLYLFGGKPTEADCCLFGNLVQIKYQMPGQLQSMLTEKFPNLSDYVERIKGVYWPDWDECHTHGNTRQPTK